MPYTPPSISPSGLHSVSPVKSSSSYAGLANGHPPPAGKQHGSSRPPVHASNHPRPTNHHRRSTGPTSPPRVPVPVATFVQDRPSPKRPSPVRRHSSSTTSSSDEDEEGSIHNRHGRRLSNLKELRDAIRELPQHKVPSPPGSPQHHYIGVSPADQLPPIATDPIPRYDSTTSDGEQSSSTPPDEDSFPRMVRKKSGEVVKPTLKSAYFRRRPQSLPSTPVYPKAVHFDAQLEHVRHFLHSEKPLAVSTNTSPTQEYTRTTEFPFEKEFADKQYQIELPNFPSGDQAGRRDLPVRVESVYLSSNGRNLIGKVVVKNLAFNKWVAVRFTFDHWQTVSEVSGVYAGQHNSDVMNRDPSWDQFTFNIKLIDFTNLENRHMLFCVRYNVGDQEFWDNNYGSNYQVEFRKRPNYLLRRASLPPEINGLSGTREDSAIADDFDDIDLSPVTFAKNLAQQISSPRSALLANLGESPPFVKKASISSPPPAPSDLSGATPQKRPTGKAFANRYDFGASLNAAIANANATIGFEHSGLQRTLSPKTDTSSQDSYFAPLPQLFRGSPAVASPNESTPEIKDLGNDIKKSHLSGLQHSHHFRSRSYPLGSPAQSPGWVEADAREGYSSDDVGTSKPSMDSISYLEFISSYCFFEPGKGAETSHPPTTEAKPSQPTNTHSLLAPPTFPSIRATARSPPPSPRKLSPVRTRDDLKHAYLDSSESNQSSPASSGNSTPRAPSPQLTRSPDRSRDPSPSIRFHHHPSPLSFDAPGVPSTAIVG